MKAAKSSGLLITASVPVFSSLSFTSGLVIALRAFPAMILGGLDSPAGAVVGGVIIGVSEVMTAGYQAGNFDFIGANFSAVMPYVVMVLILLVRPYGLFGTREVRRV